MKAISTRSVALAKCVATAGEDFSDAMIDLVADPSDPSGLRLLFWNGTNAKIAPRIKYGRRTYEAVALDPTVVRGVRWPTRSSDCGRTRELFNRILNLVTKNVGIPEEPARLLVYFVFSTWFPDRLTVAPGLAIVGSAVTQAIQLLRFLRCVCRRSILLVGMNSARLYVFAALTLSDFADRPTDANTLTSKLSQRK